MSFFYILKKIVNINNGDLMKKVLILLILIFIFSFILNKNKIQTVFSVDTEYEIYYLDFRKVNLNTNNFNDYFNNNNMDIIKIEPYVNPIYKDKIKNLNYLFDYYSNESNIKKFKERYLKEIKNNNYIDDYNKYLINGIKIEMVKVYSNYKEILELISLNNKIKYTFTYIDYQKI